eukprot:CAMPEP_0197717010 /NCGR_PEP_ID=MMETSP1434-20131217/1706_1 /TAXON_ID=265543 /ORGANISM="Minutocellus polymorphus, Strain CCMP3303" /LENGTH=273 /DNA_ID=CAMNT_0043301479 /DNA_START=10 /DNA_END=831 /DNA_ORIENTATION=+
MTGYRRLAAGLALAGAVLPTCCLAFSSSTSHISVNPARNGGRSVTSLLAKKKGSAAGAKGFGKSAPPAAAPIPPAAEQPAASSVAQSTSNGVGGLQSIEGASATATTGPPPIDLDPSLNPEERAQKILREQYGLKPAAETAQDVAQARREMELAGTLKKRKDKLDKYRQMTDEEFDIFQVIPAPLLKFIDIFLKGGLAITTTLFISAGIGITFEAWSKATGSDLPEGWDEFIVNTIEPNFTTGLLVLLGFSISLGIFASAQLGSGSSVYSEDP